MNILVENSKTWHTLANISTTSWQIVWANWERLHAVLIEGTRLVALPCCFEFPQGLLWLSGGCVQKNCWLSDSWLGICEGLMLV